MKCLDCDLPIPHRPGRGRHKERCPIHAAEQKKKVSALWAAEHKERTKEINTQACKNYLLAHPDRRKATAFISNLKRRVSLLTIIGDFCVGKDCLNPYKPVEVDHIAETGYWSGYEHRQRVGGGKQVEADLLRLHKFGADIAEIVQPLCKSCNLSKRNEAGKSHNH